MRLASKPHQERHVLAISNALHVALNGDVPETMIVEAKAALDNLVEQLEAMREALEEIVYAVSATRSTARQPKGTVYNIARAALASNPASELCRYCAGKGGRRRSIYSRFAGTDPVVHEGPWEPCSFCNGSGEAQSPAKERP